MVRLLLFLFIVVGMSTPLTACKVKIVPPPDPTPEECFRDPNLQGCEYSIQPGYGKRVSNRTLCLTESNSCDSAPTQPADLAWLSQFDAADLTMSVSGTNMVYAVNGAMQFQAKDMQGNIISTYEAPWSRTGSTIVLTNPYGVNQWVASLPASVVGEVVADTPITFGAGTGFVTLSVYTNLDGVPIDLRTEAFYECGAPGGLPSGPNATRNLCP